MSILFLIGRFVLGNWKVFAIGGLLIGYTLYWEHHGAVRVQGKFDAYKVSQKALADRIAKDWVDVTKRVEGDAFSAQERRDATFQPIVKESHALPPQIRSTVVAAPVVRLLDHAIATVNAAGPAPEPAETAHPDSAVTQGQLTDWAIDVLRIHRECTDRVAEWESFYRGLREAH
jgi:hypothetical protein